jgi:hypothetical protein
MAGLDATSPTLCGKESSRFAKSVCRARARLASSDDKRFDPSLIEKITPRGWLRFFYVALAAPPRAAAGFEPYSIPEWPGISTPSQESDLRRGPVRLLPSQARVLPFSRRHPVPHPRAQQGIEVYLVRFPSTTSGELEVLPLEDATAPEPGESGAWLLVRLQGI